MKVYLLQNPACIEPFGKRGGELQLGLETLEQRLTRQFARHQLSLIRVQDKNQIPGNESRIVLTERTFLSDAALEKFVHQASKTGSNSQLEIDAAEFEALRYDEAPAQPVLIDLFHFRNPTAAQPLRLPAESVYSVPTGMPAAIYKISNCRVEFPTVFAVQINSWMDYLTAVGLACREYTANSILQTSKWLPRPCIHKLLQSPRIAKMFNRIGRNCRIHPTAVLEGCVIGDDVEIGPYAYLRSAIVGNGAVVREHSSVKVSMVGPGSFIMPCDLFQACVGRESVIFTSIFHNSVLGDRSFIGGGTGFSDFNAAKTTILTRTEGGLTDSQIPFLGSAVGNDCFLGAGLIFKSGEIIPSGTQILNPTMIHQVPSLPDQLYAAQNGKLLKLPKSFLSRGKDNV